MQNAALYLLLEECVSQIQSRRKCLYVFFTSIMIHDYSNHRHTAKISIRIPSQSYNTSFVGFIIWNTAEEKHDTLLRAKQKFTKEEKKTFKRNRVTVNYMCIC